MELVYWDSKQSIGSKVSSQNQFRNINHGDKSNRNSKNFMSKFIKVFPIADSVKTYQKGNNKMMSIRRKSEFNEEQLIHQRNNNVLPYCLDIVNQRIQNNSTTLRPKRDVIKYVLGEPQAIKNEVTNKLREKMKMKKGTLEKFDQLTDKDKKMKKRHITEKMKDKRDMKLPFEETKHTKINEMMKTVKDRDVGRTNKRNEIDDNHSDELKHDEKRKRKRVKQVKEHKKDSRVKDKKKSSELQENKDHLEEEEEDEVQNTKEDRKAVQLSKFTQPMKDQSITRHTVDNDDKFIYDVAKVNQSKMYTDENVLSSPLQYYTTEEEIENNQPRDTNPKKSIKPSKNRQKLWNTSDENDDNHKVISEKDQTVHINPQEVHHRMRTKGELLSKSEINNDDDDNDVYHRVPVNKVSAEQKHKVTLSSKYDATVHDDDDEDDNSDGGKEFHHETDRKPPAHKRKRVMRHTNSDFIEEQVKPDEFSHPKRRRHLKNVTSRRYRTPSHESSSEDIFFNRKYATGCQAYSREGCKCTCEQSHDRDIRIHCHPVHDTDTGSHFICHLNESSPLYSHHCKDVEDEDILDVLEQICADRRRLRRKRCCNHLSIGKQSNKIKSVDLKRYLSPKTIKLLKTVEKPSVFDNLPMTCLENELKHAISSCNKLHSTSDTENECYEYNKKHLSKSIPNYPIQRDTPSNIPNISQSVQQCQTNTFPNPNNIQTYCPTVLPVISPSRVLVRHIPVPVVIPQCLSTNQLIYPYSIPATQLVVQPNYFMPNTSQRFNYASPYSQYS